MQLNNSWMFWSLLSFFITYWFIFFPIIWFVVQPAVFTDSHLSTILYAMFFVAVFILLFGIIYCCFKRTQKRHIARQEPEIFRRLESVEERPNSKKAPYFERKNRPLSKCVLIPTVPMTEKNEGVKCTRGEANRDSLITIPLCVNDDGDVDKSNYVIKQEL